VFLLLAGGGRLCRLLALCVPDLLGLAVDCVVRGRDERGGGGRDVGVVRRGLRGWDKGDAPGRAGAGRLVCGCSLVAGAYGRWPLFTCAFLFGAWEGLG
jgi:hypothetical protein